MTTVTPAPDSGHQTEVLGEPARRLAVILLGLLALVATLSLTAGHRGREISLFDEATHADYAYQVAHGHLPARGSLLDPSIRREWSCRGSTVRVMPPCTDEAAPPAAFPSRGEDYNFGHPPVYYAITGVLVRLLPGDNFITAARNLGTLWLYAGMVVMFFALRRFGIRWQLATAGAALLPLCPGVLHASSAVTNDAPAVLGGALGLLLLARLLVEGRTGWLLPAILTAFICSTKALNALPLLALAGVATALAIAQRRSEEPEGPRSRDLLVLAGAIGLSFLVVYGGWAVVQSGRGVSDWVNPVAGISSKPVVGSPLDELLSTSLGSFGLVTGYYLQPQVSSEAVMIWARLVNVLLIAAPFMALVAYKRRSGSWLVGAATLTSLAVYPLLVELQVYLTSNSYFPTIIPRYGMALIPWVIACLALVAHRFHAVRLTTLTVASGALIMLLAVTGVW